MVILKCIANPVSPLHSLKVCKKKKILCVYNICEYHSCWGDIGGCRCDAPKPGCPLTIRQPAEYSWMPGNSTPLMKIGQSLLGTGSSTQI